MSRPPYRALVVDDEAAVRQLTVRSLAREGFICDAAACGREAGDLLDGRDYELVVTDLRMPDGNGHALAVDLLERKNRPLIAVLTGVVEPKLAKDLVARGVDELMFKPVDYILFAAKLKAMVDRHIAQRQSNKTTIESTNPQQPLADCVSIDPAELEAKLSQVSRILPLSQAALDVYNLTDDEKRSGQEIAAAIQCDAALTAELLRLANSSFYNPTAEKISDLGHWDRAGFQSQIRAAGRSH